MNRTRGTVALFAISVALLISGSAAGRAQAAVTCDFDTVTGVLSVDVTSGTPVAMLSRESPSGEILVDDDSDVDDDTAIACTNGTPTTATTSSIEVDESTANQSTTLRLDFTGGRLVPGTGDTETGKPEIEIEYATDAVGEDAVMVSGPAETAAQRFSFGAISSTDTGVDLNDDDDVDDLAVEDLEHLLVEPGQGSDRIEADGSGSSSFTGPLTIETDVFASLGDDTFMGGNGNNAFTGGAGADEMTGGSGPDSFDMGDHDDMSPDTYDGGGGTFDFASWEGEDSIVGVTLDLGVTAPQDTLGFGIDQVRNAEHIVGSDGPDRLTGNGEDNIIFGGNISQDTGDDVLYGAGGADTLWARAGDDLLTGGAGDDILIGEAGNDTAGFALGSTAAVTFSLDPLLTGDEQVTGGAGGDTLGDSNSGSDPDDDHEVENVIGSPFGGDDLTGNAFMNRIDAHDGLADTVDCVLPELGDEAVLDELGVDTVSNCEIVDNAPQTSFGAGGPGDGATISDTTPTYPVTANEISDFEFRVGAGDWTGCSGACTIPTPLADGTHTLSFRAVDQDENERPDLTPVSRTLTVDATAPDTSISGKSRVTAKAKRRKKPKARVTWQVSSDDSQATVECSLDGAPFVSCAGTFSAVLKPGRHTLRARATDALGNVDASPAAFQTHVTKKKKKKRRKK